jgi:pilus assembly protein CpaF
MKLSDRLAAAQRKAAEAGQPDPLSSISPEAAAMLELDDRRLNVPDSARIREAMKQAVAEESAAEEPAAADFPTEAEVDALVDHEPAEGDEADEVEAAEVPVDEAADDSDDSDDAAVRSVVLAMAPPVADAADSEVEPDPALETAPETAPETESAPIQLESRRAQLREAAHPSNAAAPKPEVGRGRYVDPLSGIKRKVHQALLDALGPTLYDARMDEQELAFRTRQTLHQVIESEATLISNADRVRITNEVSDEILGYGPIEPFLRDPDITEVMVNGYSRIYVERRGKITQVDAAFTDDMHLRRTIEKIVARIGRRIDESSPMVDARLPDGSRVNAVISPVSLDGPMLTIRKFAADPYQVEHLISFGTMTASTAALLEVCVRGRLNILISGGTGSGKTTTLNVVSSFVPSNERIVTIEDAAELQLHQDHVVRMETRPVNIEGRGEITTRDLVRNSLRMRPDRIIVGEVRDGAALDMLQAMNTGHDGSLTTLHANTPRDALSRLETMVLMAGVDLPNRAIREQAASAIDLIVQQARLRDGTRRITHITEVTGMESDVITTQDLFTFDYSAGLDETGRFKGTLRPTGVRPLFIEKLLEQGLRVPARLFATG